tara:strand:+ start:45 stop:737 length:693 start_codon:yes stop_codon:yes gene_type:complete
MPILFDIDNTLLDDNYAVKQACSALHDKYKDKLDIHLEEFIEKWNETLEEYFEMYLRGEITFQDQRMRRAAKIFDLDLSMMNHEVADEIFNEYLHAYENNWRLFPDVKPCLNALKGEQLGIISNGDFAQQTKKLQKMNLTDYFSSIIISSKAGYSKPDARIFEEACKAQNAEPHECTYIGDKLETDARACEKIGMKGVWLNRNKSVKNEPNDIKIFHSLEDLPELLKKAA